jgi:hypothetical protein
MGESPKRAENFFRVSRMLEACRVEISFAVRRRSNSDPTRLHKSAALIEEASRSKWAMKKSAASKIDLP